MEASCSGIHGTLDVGGYDNISALDGIDFLCSNIFSEPEEELLLIDYSWNNNLEWSSLQHLTEAAEAAGAPNDNALILLTPLKALVFHAEKGDKSSAFV